MGRKNQINEEKTDIQGGKVWSAKATACTNVSQFPIFLLIAYNPWWTISHPKDVLYILNKYTGSF